MNEGIHWIFSTLLLSLREWINHFRLMFEVDPLLEEAMGDLWALVRVEGTDSHYQLFNTPYM